jgi:hypothetical protein
MMRPAIRIVFLFAALAFSVVVFYLLQKERRGAGDATALLSPSADIIIRIDRYASGSAKLRNARIEGWDMSDAASGAGRIIQLLDSLHAYSTEWNELISPAPCWLVIPAIARPDEWVLIQPLRHGDELSDPAKLFAAWGNASFSSSEFKGTTIHSSARVHYATQDDCLLIASARSALEGSVIAGSEQVRVPYLAECMKVSSSDAPVHVYLKSPQGRWALDMPYLASMTGMTGYSFGDSLLMPLSTEGSFGAADFLPSTTVYLESWSYETGADLWNAAEHIQPENARKYWSAMWPAQGDSCQCDLQEALLDWQSGEWGNALLSDAHTRAVRFIGIRDSLNALSMLRPLLGDSVVSGSLTVYRIRYPELFRRNAIGILTSPAYLAQSGNYIWLAENEADFSALNGSPLSKSPEYASAVRAVQPAGGHWSYRHGSVSGALPPVVSQWCGESQPLAIHSTANGANRQHTIWTGTLTADDLLAAPPSEEASAAEGWKVPLPAAATAHYWLVKNHNTGHDEMLVQDAKHAIHLINPEGELLWSRMLSGPVMGGVNQVDALKNGRLQMAFNTREQLYIIDRNGKDLAGFPVQIQSGASCPVKVADYDGDKTYRLLVGCENGQVLNYTVEGKPTKGWKGYKAKSAVSAVDHFRLGNEDYLLCWPSGKPLVLLRRTGELRMEPKGSYADYDGGGYSIRRALDITSCGVAFVRKNGKLVTVEFGSGAEKVITDAAGKPAFLTCHDLNADQKPDYLFASGKDIQVFDASGERLFGAQLPSDIGRAPEWFAVSSTDGRIGLPLADQSYHLMSFKGEPMEGFPMSSCTGIFYSDFRDGGGVRSVILSGSEVRAVAR